MREKVVMPLIGLRAYARWRKAKGLPGGSPAAVGKALAAGRISRLADGRIDAAAADEAWRLNTTQRCAQSHVEENGRPAQVGGASKAASAVEGGGDSLELRPRPASGLTPLTSARIHATEESAAIRSIQRRRLEGALLEVEEVDRTLAEILQICKDRLRLIADNVAPTLASCTTEAECRSVVLREVDDALAVLSEGVKNLVNT